jgi:TPP-dependent trihydroxycyclohexane-1,2-dione (THcHDO) dehydratase
MKTSTERLTMAQALVKFLINQHIERDGETQPFFAGCFGIFGHGNVSGIGQALQQYPALRYYQTTFRRHEHDHRRRRGAHEPTPVLLLPGDIFAGNGT